MLRRLPMLARCLPLFLLLFTSCMHVRDWRELRTEPMPIGQCYEGLDYIAAAVGFVSDASVSDRGEGIWQSRWRGRVLDDPKRHLSAPPKSPTRIGRAIATLQEVMDDLGDTVATAAHRAAH